MNLKLAKNEDSLPIALDSIYFLHRNGDHQSAHTLYLESKKDFENSPIHNAVLKLVNLIGKYEQAQLTATDYAELFNTLRPLIDRTDCNLYQGWLHLLMGFYTKNQDELKKAVQFFLAGFLYNELFETYYWMDNFKILPNDPNIISFLRLYPARSIYSKIMGNIFYKNEIIPVTVLQKNQAKIWLHEDDDEQFDCWMIENNSFTPARYSLLNLNEDTFLDLYSGLIKDRGEYLFLMLSELNCLSYLLATELTGTSITSLAEFLGRSEDDTASLIETLKTMGIFIKKIKNNYFLQWEKKPITIIPRGLKIIGLQEFVKNKLPSFSKKELIDLLELTQLGAESLMKKWALAGFIRPVDKKDNKNIWKFV